MTNKTKYIFAGLIGAGALLVVTFQNFTSSNVLRSISQSSSATSSTQTAPVFTPPSYAQFIKGENFWAAPKATLLDDPIVKSSSTCSSSLAALIQEFKVAACGAEANKIKLAPNQDRLPIKDRATAFRLAIKKVDTYDRCKVAQKLLQTNNITGYKAFWTKFVAAVERKRSTFQGQGPHQIRLADLNGSNKMNSIDVVLNLISGKNLNASYTIATENCNFRGETPVLDCESGGANSIGFYFDTITCIEDLLYTYESYKNNYDCKLNSKTQKLETVGGVWLDYRASTVYCAEGQRAFGIISSERYAFYNQSYNIRHAGIENKAYCCNDANNVDCKRYQEAFTKPIDLRINCDTGESDPSGKCWADPFKD
jgi:hypothetical protein